MSPALIDSHCHLADEAYVADLGAVIDRARAAGLERALVILEAGKDEEASRARRVHELWPETRVAIGVHPHHAQVYGGDAKRAAHVVREQVARTPFARAIGEIGLDYHYDYSPRDVQLAVFRSQVRLARELKLPIVVHSREAETDTIDGLRSAGGGEVNGVLHCFTGTRELAEASLDMGFYLSVAGIVTFPGASDLRDIVRYVPLDRLLVETDSPFLAPAPHRGSRNEPAHVNRVAETVAGIKGVSVAELARITTANFHALFRP